MKVSEVIKALVSADEKTRLRPKYCITSANYLFNYRNFMKNFIFSLCFLLSLPAMNHPAMAASNAELVKISPLIDFLPPPPAPGDPDFERDVVIYQNTRAEKGGPRWEQAAIDAEDKKYLDDLFLEAFGLKINSQTTPATRELLDLVIIYVAKTINPAKEHYKSIRPFDYFQALGSTCAPAHETWLSTNSSYPSGHSARGWGLALILAEISPERQGAILKRGYELGQSRVICGVHWQSDVDSGRLAASAAIVQLHNDPAFLNLLKKAKAEINELRHPAIPKKKSNLIMLWLQRLFKVAATKHFS